MSMRHTWTVLILVGLTSCTLEPDPSLALACQITKCVCTPQNWSFPTKNEPAPVLWRQNGDAHCPDSHVLRRATEDN